MVCCWREGSGRKWLLLLLLPVGKMAVAAVGEKEKEKAGKRELVLGAAYLVLIVFAWLPTAG